MLELEKWGEDKPKNIVILAHEFATGAVAAYHFLLTVKDRKRPEGYFDLPHISKWLNFYAGDQTIGDYFISIPNDGEDLEWKELTEELKALRKGDKYYLEKLKKDLKLLGPEGFRIRERQREKNLKKNYELHLEELREDIEGKKSKSEGQAELEEILKDDYMKFFIRVYAPCWFLYGKRPDELMSRAREGHMDSLKKLLQIDKAIVADESIGQLFHEYSTQKNKRKFDALVSALANSPTKKISIGRVKSNIAGFISVFSEKCGHRLFEPDLRALFSAVAVDYGRYEQIDEDIPVTPATFSQAIRREREFWENNLFPKPYKTI